MKKRLLVYAHYFYPDVASTGQILTELCEGIQHEFDVTVIAVVPSYDGKVDFKYKTQRFYKEKYQNIEIVRVRVPEFDKKNKLSRVKNILGYFLNATLATFKVGKQDVVFSISQPPILGGMLGVIGKIVKGAKFVYNIQDFNPEQTEAVGYAKNKLILNFARMLDKFSCRVSDTVVVVGRDMQGTLINRFKGKKVPKSAVINNWIDEKQIYPLPEDHPRVMEFKKQYGLDGKFIFMYSGNIGLYYDLENIIKVIGEFKDRDDVVFAFVGDGSVKQSLVDYVNDNRLSNVKFIPYQKKEDLIYSLNSADVHIVTNAKGIKGVSVPSKVYGVMATGKFIFGVLEHGSEARLLIEDSKCGVCCESADYKNIKHTISSIIEGKVSLGEIALSDIYSSSDVYGRNKSINKYKELIENLV